MATKKGAKLNKSEVIPVRFDPILKMAAELAAGKERRTMSSFTEMAVEQAVKQCVVARDEEGNPVNAWQVAYECWHVEPALRLNALASRYPDTMTIRERKIIDGKKYVAGTSVQMSDDGKLVETILTKEGWEDLCLYADDQIDFAELISRLRAVQIKRESA